MFTAILCGECGGNYVPTDATETEWCCIEGDCLHTITLADVVLDEGERASTLGDVLGYFTNEAVA